MTPLQFQTQVVYSAVLVAPRGTELQTGRYLLRRWRGRLAPKVLRRTPGVFLDEAYVIGEPMPLGEEQRLKRVFDYESPPPLYVKVEVFLNIRDVPSPPSDNLSAWVEVTKPLCQVGSRHYWQGSADVIPLSNLELLELLEMEGTQA
jgi:hypothetical protein